MWGRKKPDTSRNVDPESRIDANELPKSALPVRRGDCRDSSFEDALGFWEYPAPAYWRFQR